MTIYDIKRLTQETSPYYFTTKALKFFGQTMRSFKLKKQPDGRIHIKAPIYYDRHFHGYSERWFNPLTNELERQ